MIQDLQKQPEIWSECYGHQPSTILYVQSYTQSFNFRSTVLLELSSDKKASIIITQPLAHQIISIWHW